MAVYFVGKEKGPSINMTLPFTSLNSAIRYAVILCKKKKLEGLAIVKINDVRAIFINEPPRLDAEFIGEVMPYNYWEYDDYGQRVKKPYPTQFCIVLYKNGGRDRHLLNANGTIGRRY